MINLKNRILRLSESDICNGEYVILDVNNQELWFTQIHIAEIKSLLQLSEEVKNANVESNSIEPDDTEAKSGLSVYNSYVGKQIKRKDGFSGIISKVDEQFVYVQVKTPSLRGGPQKDEITKIQLSFVIGNTNIYTIGWSVPTTDYKIMLKSKFYMQ